MAARQLPVCVDEANFSLFSFFHIDHDDERSLETSVHVCLWNFNYHYLLTVLTSYNKYAQITARAVRSSLKETERLAAEKRGVTTARFQKWENGVGGVQVRSILPFYGATKMN